MSPRGPYPPSLRYLASITTETGVFEHARFARPRVDHGYCTDDAGRLLALAARLAHDPSAERCARVALGFLERAYAGGGELRLRLHVDGRWEDGPATDDATGRALLGLGVAAVRAPWIEVRTRARALFGEVAGMRSVHPRANAYAALGAVELVAVDPHHPSARALVTDAADLLPRPRPEEAWPWPEDRLTYANALVPHAMLEVAVVTADRQRATEALHLLGWLDDVERLDGHFSFTAVSGRGPGDPSPMFDQQPIEAWAMAEACASALRHTGDPRWAEAVEVAAAWFLGDNDVGVALCDPLTGGGFDGLRPGGVNLNEGCESSLALVATMLCRRLVGHRLASTGRAGRAPRFPDR